MLLNEVNEKIKVARVLVEYLTMFEACDVCHRITLDPIDCP